MLSPHTWRWRDGSDESFRMPVHAVRFLICFCIVHTEISKAIFLFAVYGVDMSRGIWYA